MPAGDVAVVCSRLGHTHSYAVDLVNLLCMLGKTVHVVQEACFDGNQDGEVVQQPIASLPSRALLVSGEHVKLYSLKSSEQAVLHTLLRQQGCTAVVFVRKDGEAGIQVQGRLPVLSFGVVLLNYENIPRSGRSALAFFDILVATGENSKRRLDMYCQTGTKSPCAMIFPRFPHKLLPSCSSDSAEGGLAAKQALGLPCNRFLYFLDVNESLEIKCVDTVVQAFFACRKEVPGFKEGAALLINAAPSSQLVDILALQACTPEEVIVHTQYYQDDCALPVTLDHMLVAADVVVDMAGGEDFNPHLFLAQEYHKYVIYRYCESTRKYCPHGAPITRQQMYYDGLAQGIMRLPSLQELTAAMRATFQGTSMVGRGPAAGAHEELANFKGKRDRFERDWKRYLARI